MTHESKEILQDFLLKRPIQRATVFTSHSYKERWFVLTNETLTYHAGTLAKRGKVKGTIYLKNVKTVEPVEDGKLDDKLNVFQVMHRTEKGDGYYTLYVVSPQGREQQKKWVDTLKRTTPNSTLHGTPRTNLPPLPDLPIQPKLNGAGPNRPVPAPRPPKRVEKEKEKKIYIAAYDYKPCEDGDLELVTGLEYEVLDDNRDHWWLAKNQTGEKGFIPANYVKKKFDLEVYEWYYKGVTRERAEAVLKEEVREGCFMVRDSSSAGMYTLSIYTTETRDGVVRHYHIKKNEDERYFLAEKHAFVTIPDLIYYHKHNAGGIATRLRAPPVKNKNAPVTAGFGHSKWELDTKDLELFEILGSGCFGTVHRGKWKGRVVAAKMMKEKAMSEDAFLEEAKTMTQLSHTNLVQLYGVVTQSKPLVIVTELMQYGSLLTYLKRHKRTLPNKIGTMVDMCIQVCAGMEYLESRSFIHRDLAARNCLVGDNQVIKVADFGLARYVIDDEYTSSTGTKFPVKWAPPEVLSYTRFSSKSDIWAFGILMWEIFTCGQMPYDQMRNAAVVDFVCTSNKRLEKPAASPERTYRIMMDCWHKDPDTRPSFTQLKRILNGLMEVGNYPQV